MEKKFQFHSGSIKSQFLRLVGLPKNAFQFHSGSIKRRPEKVVEWSGRFCFNSIVVRLKVWAHVVRYGEVPGFNSIVVRLKAGRCRGA